ncbi:hypothetical protein [Corynebacterium tapiri]|uniref:Uncharacterized protein n=1 Tax=Corynebacterium tapiri TaxID=1448266 RepID=A0A5C4U440_9CORY|nr:hypothetical protein [Corynebacterium tapiri]TNL97285.1 hypothetical protein FHE74_06325 [Corynebacterium tapiri]
MGRLLLLLLVVLAIYLLWRAFGPQSRPKEQPPAIKGPDDDPDFLWNIEKERFKQRRAEEERRKRQQRRDEGDKGTES